jgi:hypothetical protein
LRVFLKIVGLQAHWLLHYKHVKVLPSFWIALYMHETFKTVRNLRKLYDANLWRYLKYILIM